MKEYKPDLYKEQYIHITLARFKKPLARNELQEINLPKGKFEDFTLNKITLYESVLRNSGPIYKIVAEFPLGK